MRNRIANLWTLGGLSVPELLYRTVLESWRDDVFGQGGRMAFYQFLAIFPSLFLAFAIGVHIPILRDHLNDAFRDLATLLFPNAVAQLLQSLLGDLHARAHFGIHLLGILGTTVWATHNGTWAMIYGLNRAYEVKEQRSWFKLTAIITVLTVSLALTTALALCVVLLGARAQGDAHTRMRTALDWIVLTGAVAFCLGLLYRFAPNLCDHKWRFSTPGTVCAVLLWLVGTFGARLYFDRFNDYTRSYGHLNAIVILLIWLYLANGAVLIGGEMNSEIQKAESEKTQSTAAQPYSSARSGK